MKKVGRDSYPNAKGPYRELEFLDVVERCVCVCGTGPLRNNQPWTHVAYLKNNGISPMLKMGNTSEKSGCILLVYRYVFVFEVGWFLVTNCSTSME